MIAAPRRAGRTAQVTGPGPCSCATSRAKLTILACSRVDGTVGDRLLHAHAKPVLKFIEPGKPTLLKSPIPKFAQQPPGHVIVFAERTCRPVQRCGLRLFIIHNYHSPGQAAPSWAEPAEAKRAWHMQQFPARAGRARGKDLRPAPRPGRAASSGITAGFRGDNRIQATGHVPPLLVIVC